MGGGPLCPDEMTNILQAVRPHGKVDFPVNVSIYIDQTLCEAFSLRIISFCELRYRSWLITTVMIDWCIRILRDLLHKLLPYVVLVLVSICPERIVFRGGSLTHQHPDQIIESPVRDPLHVHKQFHGLSR